MSRGSEFNFVCIASTHFAAVMSAVLYREHSQEIPSTLREGIFWSINLLGLHVWEYSLKTRLVCGSYISVSDFANWTNELPVHLKI